MKKLLLLLIALGIPGIQGFAQENSTVDVRVVICADRAIVDLSGFMDPGFDLFLQAQDANNAPISNLEQVSVDGAYQLSRTIIFTGQQIPTGATGNLFVSIARESDPNDSQFSTSVSDVQDGCPDTTAPETDADTGQAAITTTTTTTQSFLEGEVTIGIGIQQQQPQQTFDPAAASVTIGVQPPPGVAVNDPNARIFSPFGGFLNPEIPPPAPEPDIVIGARPSEVNPPPPPGRTSNPGLIFAECNDFRTAEPGIIYDTDNLVVFWSWFARTQQQVQDHIENARYDVKLNGQIFPRVQLSEIQKREDGNFWVFYIVNLGTAWRPGNYGISFRLQWAQPITDGFLDFGPGTPNPLIDSGCNFAVQKNPFGIEVVPENPKVPLESF